MTLASTRLALALAIVLTGCMGEIRDTTTARGSTEMLLLSSAAESAVRKWDPSRLSNRRVHLDTQYLESVDEPYVTSALRAHVAGAGAILVERTEADLVIEIRCAALGCWDGEYLYGVPPLPLGYSGMTGISPDLTIGNTNRQAWAKLQLFVYDPGTLAIVATSGDLWGAAREDLIGSVYPSLLDQAKELAEGDDGAPASDPDEVAVPPTFDD